MIINIIIIHFFDEFHFIVFIINDLVRNYGGRALQIKHFRAWCAHTYVARPEMGWHLCAGDLNREERLWPELSPRIEEKSKLVLHTLKSERALDPGIKKPSRGRHAWRKNPGFPAGVATMDTSEST